MSRGQNQKGQVVTTGHKTTPGCQGYEVGRLDRKEEHSNQQGETQNFNSQNSNSTVKAEINFADI